ncbi:MAG: hypothetical protein LUD72_14020 [Bacteroidales bacterium]|nr:hypothetical protein [Bacteroidales bacterium]
MSKIELPWGIDQTIADLDLLRMKLMSDARRKNFDGRGEKDAQEINFDFSRAIEALKLMKIMGIGE